MEIRLPIVADQVSDNKTRPNQQMKKLIGIFLLILLSTNIFCQTVPNSDFLRPEEPERLNKTGNYITGQFFGADLSIFQFLDPKAPVIPQYSLDIKGGYKLTSIWGARAIVGIGANRTAYSDTRFNISGNYVGCYYQGDICFDLTEALFSNRNNNYNMILFAGAGLHYSFGRGDKFYNSNYQVKTIWRYTTQQAYQAGIINSWYLNKDLSFNAEVQAKVISKRWQGVDTKYIPQIISSFKLGITYYFSNKKTDKTPLPELSDKIDFSEREETIRRSIEYITTKGSVYDDIEKPVNNKKLSVNIFFDLNKAIIPDQEREKLNNIALFFASNPDTEIKILGFSDMMTGNHKYNLAISEKRAVGVAEILVNEFNIPAEKITYHAKGDSEQPFTINQLNRVCIIIVE